MPPRPPAPKLSSQIITDVDKQAVRDTAWPAIFNKKVDTSKINMGVIKAWIEDKLAQLGNDDDVMSSLVVNLLEANKFVCYEYLPRFRSLKAYTKTFLQPKIKEIQVQIGNFLGKDAPAFSKELWGLCLEAQDAPNGVPPALVAAKKDELRKQKEAEAKAREEEVRRREAERNRDREREEALSRERDARGGRFGGGRNDRYDRRGGRPMGRRDQSLSSSSPPPRRRHGDQQSYSNNSGRGESYVPRGGRDRPFRRDNDRRSRSPAPRHRRNSTYDRRDDRRDNRRGADNYRPRSPLARRRRSTTPPSRRSRSPEPQRRRRQSPPRSATPVAVTDKDDDKKEGETAVKGEEEVKEKEE
ncbi:hypothetical protein MBLNU230_g4718t1 [Neophaeotheca triangularis]